MLKVRIALVKDSNGNVIDAKKGIKKSEKIGLTVVFEGAQGDYHPGKVVCTLARGQNRIAESMIIGGGGVDTFLYTSQPGDRLIIKVLTAVVTKPNGEEVFVDVSYPEIVLPIN